jgi:hypothetical protein
MLEEFANEARRFVHWAAGKTDEPMEVGAALRRIVALYFAALHLPVPYPDSVSTRREESRVDQDEWNLIYARASTLPFKNYGEVFNPISVPPEEPSVGDIADDIADIYRDVASGLRLYEGGNAVDARWEWSFNFQYHWGRHACSAIRALHCYLAETDVDRFTGDT